MLHKTDNIGLHTHQEVMTHSTTQAQIFYILSDIDYSKSWDSIYHDLGYTLGDHFFDNEDTYKLVRQSARLIWALFNGVIGTDGNHIKK